MSLFKVDLDWSSNSFLDPLENRDKDSVQTVTDFLNKFEQTFQYATLAQHLADARQVIYNEKHYTPTNYEMVDKFYLSRKLFSDSSSSARLS